MAGVNKVILLGNLGADPEVRYLESGTAVASVSLATTESYKDRNGQRVDRTEWHRLEMWDGLAKIAEQYLKKGDSIYAEGKIRSETWTDPEGNERKSFRIRVTNMTMLSKRSGAESTNTQGGNTMQQANTPTATTQQLVNDPLASASADASEVDDLPF